MFPVLPLGPLTIPVRPFPLLLGLWLGLARMEQESRRKGIRATVAADALWGLAIGYGFLAWIAWERSRSRLKASGSAFLLALVLYSGVCLISGGFRAERLTWLGFSVPQRLAFVGMPIGEWGLVRTGRSASSIPTRSGRCRDRSA